MAYDNFQCNITTPTTSYQSPTCCPSDYQCLPNGNCQSKIDNALITQQLCSTISLSYPDSNSSTDTSWTQIVIYPTVIIISFALLSLIIFLFHRHRKHRVPRGWHASARTGEEDGELPSYAEHWRSRRPWWSPETASEVEIEVECGDPPPKYPECPKYSESLKYPEAVLERIGRDGEGSGR